MNPHRGLPLAVLGPLALAIAVIGLVLVLAGSGSDRSSDVVARSRPTAPLNLATVSPEIAGHYRAARAHADTYQDIPCYCGCEAFLDHRNLYDCFVRADGAGWEPHASGCGVCIAESITAQRLLADGLDSGAIRQAVMDQFGSTAVTTPQP